MVLKVLAVLFAILALVVLLVVEICFSANQAYAQLSGQFPR